MTPENLLESDESVSVVIPYSPEHTPERYLDEAIESVDSQSVPTEVIVIKDEECRGPAWCRNRGLDQAETRFVAFLDADDIWKDNKLSRQLNRVSETDAGICVEGPRGMSKDRFYKELLIGSLRSLTPTILLDTDKVNARFEEDIERFEDHIFMIESAAEAGICFCPDLVEIRKHNGGLTSRGSPKMRTRSRVRVAEIIEERIPEAQKYLNEFLLKTYYAEGRRLQMEKKYREAIPYLLKALQSQIHYKPLAVLGLSVAGILYHPVKNMLRSVE